MMTSLRMTITTGMAGERIALPVRPAGVRWRWRAMQGMSRA
ncbi:hypothetical protein [Neoroseomonas terrae]|nr:hypothetical protein [Neoroseomonas terrae]